MLLQNESFALGQSQRSSVKFSQTAITSAYLDQFLNFMQAVQSTSLQQKIFIQSIQTGKPLSRIYFEALKEDTTISREVVFKLFKLIVDEECLSAFQKQFCTIQDLIEYEEFRQILKYSALMRWIK